MDYSTIDFEKLHSSFLSVSDIHTSFADIDTFENADTDDVLNQAEIYQNSWRTDTSEMLFNELHMSLNIGESEEHKENYRCNSELYVSSNIRKREEYEEDYRFSNELHVSSNVIESEEYEKNHGFSIVS